MHGKINSRINVSIQNVKHNRISLYEKNIFENKKFNISFLLHYKTKMTYTKKNAIQNT